MKKILVITVAVVNLLPIQFAHAGCTYADFLAVSTSARNELAHLMNDGVCSSSPEICNPYIACFLDAPTKGTSLGRPLYGQIHKIVITEGAQKGCVGYSAASYYEEDC